MLRISSGELMRAARRRQSRRLMLFGVSVWRPARARKVLAPGRDL